MEPIAEKDYLIGWIGFRVWKSRATLGLSIRGSAPFSYRGEIWALIITPMLVVASDGPGDGSVRFEWLGVAVYLRMTV